MRSTQLSGNPGELLFNFLLTKCTTKKARISAAYKILPMKGGNKTVEAAHKYGLQRIIELKEMKTKSVEKLVKLSDRKHRMSDIEYEVELAKLEIAINNLTQNAKKNYLDYMEVIDALDAAVKQFNDEQELNDIIEFSKDVYLREMKPKPQ